MQDELFCYFTTYLKTPDLEFEMQMLMQSLFPEFLSVEYLILVMWVKSWDTTFSVVLNIFKQFRSENDQSEMATFPRNKKKGSIIKSSCNGSAPRQV